MSSRMWDIKSSRNQSKGKFSTPTFSLKIEGAKAIYQGLKALPEKIAVKVLRKMLNKGASTLQRAIKKVTPVGPTGNLKRGIVVLRPKIFRNSSLVSAISAATKKGVRVKGVAYHWWLVEYGTGPRWVDMENQKGYRGIMPASKFLHTAFTDNSQRILDSMIKKGRDEILSELTKMVHRA